MPQPSLTHYELISHEMLEHMAARSAKKEGSSVITVKDGVLNCKSVARDEQAWVYWNVFLPLGATVEVTFEGRNINSDSEGRMTLDLFPDSTKVGGGQQDYIEMDKNGFKAYSFGYTSTKDGYASITFGLWDALIGECEFRNIAIKIYGGLPRPEFRQCLLKCTGSTWWIDDGFGRFSNIGIKSVEVESSAKRLKINWAKVNSWGRPIMHATISLGGSSDFIRWQAHPSGQNSEFGYLYITDASGNKVISTPSGSEDLFVAITLISS
jgi:hypothetical protein